MSRLRKASCVIGGIRILQTVFLSLKNACQDRDMKPKETEWQRIGKFELHRLIDDSTMKELLGLRQGSSCCTET